MKIYNLLKTIIVVGLGIIMNLDLYNKKTAYIFDLDDTLILTDARIYLFTPDNIIYKAFTTDSLKYKKKYIKDKINEGYIIHFDEVGDDLEKTKNLLMNGLELIKNVEKLKSANMKFTNDLFILTARGHKPEIIGDVIYQRFGVNLPVPNIIPISYEPIYKKIEEELFANNSHCPILEEVIGYDKVISDTQIKKKGMFIIDNNVWISYNLFL